MNTKTLIARLNRIADSDDFPRLAAEIVADQPTEDDNSSVVAEILKFIEEHPDTNFGLPGPLIHYVERFRNRGYERELLASVNRKPCVMTLWMLNRLINGNSNEVARAALIEAMGQAARNSQATPASVGQANHFLERLRRR